MAYVVSAKWRAKEGKSERLLEVIRELTPPSRAEAGNLFYQAQRSLEDPRLFYLYEQYTDEAGYQAAVEAVVGHEPAREAGRPIGILPDDLPGISRARGHEEGRCRRGRKASRTRYAVATGWSGRARSGTAGDARL